MLIEERTLFLIPAAPVLVPARNPKELAGPDPLLTGLIPVQVGTPEHDEREIVRVTVHARVESRHKLGESAMRSFVGVSPGGPRGSPCHPFRISDLLGTSEGHRVISSLPLLAVGACGCR